MALITSVLVWDMARCGIVFLAAVTVAIALLIGVSVGQSDCTPGYEPSMPYPLCSIRRQDVFNYLFAVLLNRSVYSSYYYTCLNTTQLAPVWSMNGTAVDLSFLEYELVGCITNGSLCYNDVVQNFSCSCLGCCTNTTDTFIGLTYYAYYNNLNVY